MPFAKIFLFLGLNVVATAVLADENYSMILRLNPGLSGSTIDKSDSSLQPYGGIYEKSVEGQYTLDKGRNSIFLGAGYANLEKNYILFLNGVGPSLDYKLEHSYVYGRIGYSIIIGNFTLKPSFRLGSGSYNFKGDQSISESGSAMIYGFDINIQGLIANSNFLYQIGAGYSQANYSDINDNGVDISNDEMNKFFSLNLGIGYGF